MMIDPIPHTDAQRLTEQQCMQLVQDMDRFLVSPKDQERSGQPTQDDSDDDEFDGNVDPDEQDDAFSAPLPSKEQDYIDEAAVHERRSRENRDEIEAEDVANGRPSLTAV